MPALTVAALQFPVGRVDANVAAICKAIDQAADQADILLTPEGALSGYTAHFDRGEVRTALTSVTDHARERGIGLALGTCFEEDDGACYNQLRFYRPDGRYLGFHSKILNCGSVHGPARGEVLDYAVAPLRVFAWNHEITLGGLICNDLWANPQVTPMDDPHLTRQLQELGADIILHAVNGGRDEDPWSDVARAYHQCNLRMRARASKIWIVSIDNAEPRQLPTASPGCVVDPHGELVATAAERGTQLLLHTISWG